MLDLRPIVIDENNMVLGGNMRLKACIEAGLAEVPVMKANLSEEKKKEFIIKDNVGYGEWSWETLANDWGTTQIEEWGLDLPLGFDNLEAEEDDYQIPDEIETNIKQGDVFEIGQHRLVCGDATDREDVTLLMGFEKADMVFTDPPYGVNVKGGKGKGNTIEGDLTQTCIPFSFELAVVVATKPQARIYFCGGAQNISLYMKLFERYLSQMPRMLIWVKNGFVMRPNGYHNGYELLFYGYKAGGGGTKHWYSGRGEKQASDVWKISRDPSSSYVHPTQKPVELPSRAIINHSKSGGIIYEPFTGSGSTMVACEQLNRKCYGIELDPKYCQVIINRMINLVPEIEIKKNGKTVKY